MVASVCIQGRAEASATCAAPTPPSRRSRTVAGHCMHHAGVGHAVGGIAAGAGALLGNYLFEERDVSAVRQRQGGAVGGRLPGVVRLRQFAGQIHQRHEAHVDHRGERAGPGDGADRCAAGGSPPLQAPAPSDRLPWKHARRPRMPSPAWRDRRLRRAPSRGAPPVQGRRSHQAHCRNLINLPTPYARWYSPSGAGVTRSSVTRLHRTVESGQRDGQQDTRRADRAELGVVALYSARLRPHRAVSLRADLRPAVGVQALVTVDLACACACSMLAMWVRSGALKYRSLQH